MPETDRRTLISTALVLFSGCLSVRDNNARTTETNSRSPTPTTAEQSPSSQTASPSRRHDSLYIQNFEPTEHCVAVTVTRSDGTVALDRTVSVFAETAVKFPAVATAGYEYQVAVTVESPERQLTAQWVVGSCPDDLGMDGGIVIRDGSTSFERDSCDAIRIRDELPVRSPPEEECQLDT